MFDNRLSKLREELGYNKKEAAEALNMPYTTYLNYENNEREPNSETLIQIAKFYNVSVDYLLGISEIKSINSDIKQVHLLTGLSETSITNLQQLCLTDSWAMIYLNRLIENLSVPYKDKKSILYEIIIYLHLIKSNTKMLSDDFALLSNNRIQRIGHNQTAAPLEIKRITEHDLIEKILLDNIMDSIRNYRLTPDLDDSPNKF